MKTLAGVLLASILLAGCSDSSTESAASNDSGNGSASGQNSDNDSGSSSGSDTDNTSSSSGSGADGTTNSDTDSGSSTNGGTSGGGSASDTDDTGSSSGSSTDTDDTTGNGTDSGAGSSGSGSGSDSDDTGSSSGSDNDSDDTGGGETSEPEPEPSTVRFTGDDFGYPLVHTGYYYVLTPDERVAYTVWATNYVEAQSLLEAMHAINGYREDYQQIKVINGGTEDLDSLVNDYCPTSGARFAAARCDFYARLAYTKTMAQDGWQIGHRENEPGNMVCFSNAGEFSGCSYSLMGFQYYSGTGEYDYPSIGNINPTTGSPIEGWQYKKNEPKISAINVAARSYVLCAREVSDIWTSDYWWKLRPALSPWVIPENPDEIEATQYGTLVVWLVNDDTVEDVYRDVVAEHDGSNLCKAAFQLDLKDVQPNANF